MKTVIILFFFLFGLNTANAQMLGVPKRAAMAELINEGTYSKPWITKEAGFEYVHFKHLDEDIHQEQVLRINKDGFCDRVILIYPMEEWNFHANTFKSGFDLGDGKKIAFKSLGKNIWEKDNGVIYTLVPHKDGRRFSIVVKEPATKG